MIKTGLNCIIGSKALLGNNVEIKHNCIIEDGATIGDNTVIDSNTIIRSNVTIGQNSFIGSNCIISEYCMDSNKTLIKKPLSIGENALIRSGSIIYCGSSIGDSFQTGHRVTIRECAIIGNNVSIGTLSDIQGDCKIGNYSRLHSNVHVGKLSEIDDYVWIFPYVVLTNDPTPPSENFLGVHVHSFAIVATGSIIMPGIEIGMDSLVGAGAIVTKNVNNYAVVVGNPAKQISDVRNIKNKITGEAVYPWRNHFGRFMPWGDSDFTTWWESLSDSEKEFYSVKNVTEDQ